MSRPRLAARADQVVRQLRLHGKVCCLLKLYLLLPWRHHAALELQGSTQTLLPGVDEGITCSHKAALSQPCLAALKVQDSTE